MLVLSQRPSDKVFLNLPDGRRVVVMITSVQGDKVRIGYAAPADIQIVRERAVDKSPRDH